MLKGIETQESHSPLKRGNHWYVVYGKRGDEVGLLQARSHLKAEELAKQEVHPDASVAYTEI